MASPKVRWVALRIDFFEASMTFTCVTACRFAKLAEPTSFLEGSDGFVTSPAASIATGLAILTQAGLSPASF